MTNREWHHHPLVGDYFVAPLHGHWVGDHSDCPDVATCRLPRTTPPSGGERSDSQMNLERKITDG